MRSGHRNPVLVFIHWFHNELKSARKLVWIIIVWHLRNHLIWLKILKLVAQNHSHSFVLMIIFKPLMKKDLMPSRSSTVEPSGAAEKYSDEESDSSPPFWLSRRAGASTPTDGIGLHSSRRAVASRNKPGTPRCSRWGRLWRASHERLTGSAKSIKSFIVGYVNFRAHLNFTHQLPHLDQFSHEKHARSTAGGVVPPRPGEVMRQSKARHARVDVHLHDVVLLAAALRVAKGIVIGKNVTCRVSQQLYQIVELYRWADDVGEDARIVGSTLEAVECDALLRHHHFHDKLSGS